MTGNKPDSTGNGAVAATHALESAGQRADACGVRHLPSQCGSGSDGQAASVRPSQRNRRHHAPPAPVPTHLAGPAAPGYPAAERGPSHAPGGPIRPPGCAAWGGGGRAGGGGGGQAVTALVGLAVCRSAIAVSRSRKRKQSAKAEAIRIRRSGWIDDAAARRRPWRKSRAGPGVPAGPPMMIAGPSGHRVAAMPAWTRRRNLLFLCVTRA